jgi:hypothetical protein
MDTGSYEALLIDGEYDNNEAVKAWLRLYDEYTEKVNSKSNNVIFGLKKQIYILSAEYQIVKNCLFAIQELHNCNLINFEKKFDITYFVKTINEYHYRFDETKDISLEASRVDKLLNNKVNQIKRIEKELQTYEQKGGSFTDTIAAVEMFIRFQLDEEKTTVEKFISYLNSMIKNSDNGKQHRRK